MTEMESGNSSCSLRECCTTNLRPSSHSNVTLPGTTPSNFGWVASVSQTPVSASNGSSAGIRSSRRRR
jgi:hypothetical protein